MASNDNWHKCPGRDCGHGPSVLSWPFPASPPAFPPPPPKCPATTRYISPHILTATGLQCKYEPGHEGDHCAFTFGDGDVFWPQEAPVAPETEVTA